MEIYVICNADGSIYSVRSGEGLPPISAMESVTPEGGFVIDLTGQESFDNMDIVEIHEGYKADKSKKKLVKIK